MLAKLRLDQTKKYEQAIATYEITGMLIDFVLGRQHYKRIGSEQGLIPQWDDIIIEKDENSQIHIQVKQQTSGDFGTHLDKCERNKYLEGKREGEKRDLSPLDKTLKSLAHWFKDKDISHLTSKKEFWIELPELTTQIKDGLQIRHLKDLCDEQIRPAVTTASDMQAQAQIDSHIRKCFEWLNTWCDFKNWDHIINALQFLKIKNAGTRVEIESKTEEKLKEVFISDKVKDVRLKILSYTTENTTFSGAITPRNLLFEVRDFLRSDIPIWTQFENSNSQWNISGTQDLEFNSEIERSKIIVPNLWNNKRVSHLKVQAACNKNCKLSESLMRIAIHQDGLTVAQFTDKNSWLSKLKSIIGDTLGVSQNDTANFRIIENEETFRSADNRPLVNLASQEIDALELHSNMLLVTWEAVKKSMDSIIMGMNEDESNELKYAVDERWRSWAIQLETSPVEQEMLFRNMLHPNAEGDGIISDLRVGPKTVNLLTEGLWLLLIVSVCIDLDNSGDWKKLTNEFHASTIALQYWSGMPGQKPKVKEIVHDCQNIIGRETADLLIFPRIHASYSEVLGLKIGESLKKDNTLADGKQLKMLITHNILFRQLIDKGKLKDLKDYLFAMLPKD